MKKIVLLILALVLLTWVVTAQTTTGQIPTTQGTLSTQETQAGQTPADQVTPAPTPEGTAQTGAMSLLAAVIWVVIFLIIGLLLVFPWLMNTIWNIRVRKHLMDDLKNVTDPAQRERFYDKLLAPIPERKGMSRFALMVAVTMIVGAVVLYLVILDPHDDLLKTIIGVLTGGLTSIIGFYFGGGGAVGPGSKPEEPEKNGDEEGKPAGGKPAGAGPAGGGGAVAPSAGQPDPSKKT